LFSTQQMIGVNCAVIPRHPYGLGRKGAGGAERPSPNVQAGRFRPTTFGLDRATGQAISATGQAISAAGQPIFARVP
jgi:hypothetical protein